MALALPLVIASGTRAAWPQESSGQAPTQTQTAQHKADQPTQGPAATPSNQALDFLGSYSTPSTISTTDSGHVSAHPPSPPAGRRLRRIETGPSLKAPWSDRPGAAGGASERDRLWTRAIQAWEAGGLIEARNKLTRLTSLEPDTPAVWFLLGGVALEEARTNSRRLAESDPAGSWNRRLKSEVLASRYPELARSILVGTLRPNLAAPPRPDASTASADPRPDGNPHSGDDHPELELESLDSLAESSPVLYHRARAALRLSQLAYDRAGRAPVFRPYVAALRALAAEQADDEPAAESEYHAALATDPTSAVLHAGLGHLLRQRLRLQPARDELAQAVELDPTDADSAFELGDVDQRLGDPMRAVPLLDRALEIDPTLLVARSSRAKAYLALGDDRRALADLEAVAPADATGESARQLAVLYRKLGRDDLAHRAEQRYEQQRLAPDGRQ